MSAHTPAHPPKYLVAAHPPEYLVAAHPSGYPAPAHPPGHPAPSHTPGYPALAHTTGYPALAHPPEIHIYIRPNRGLKNPGLISMSAQTHLHTRQNIRISRPCTLARISCSCTHARISRALAHPPGYPTLAHTPGYMAFVPAYEPPLEHTPVFLDPLNQHGLLSIFYYDTVNLTIPPIWPIRTSRWRV